MQPVGYAPFASSKRTWVKRQSMPRKNEVKCRHVDTANAKCTQDSQDALTANIAQTLFFNSRS